MITSAQNRRDFLRGIGAGVASLALGRFALGADEGEAPPNVLFIAIDDLNDWTGCLGGHPNAQTPNLDRLSKRGVLFTNAHCAAPACGPSRAALLTGIRPCTSGVYKNRQSFRRSKVLKNAVTLPQHFRANGYAVSGSGKIFHGGDPDPRSWDEYWPSKTKTRPGDPTPAERPVNGIPKTRHFDWGPLAVRNDKMGDWQVADWTVRQLQKQHNKPFFLGCGFFRPHLPWYVPQKYFDMFPADKITLPNVKEDDLDDVPKLGRRMARPQGDHRKVTKHKQWRKAVQGYLASIKFVDDCLGRVIDAFDRSRYKDNTIIVLWSDHGWHLGEKLHWRKFALWEEATHNVFTVVAPGVTKPDARCSRPVSMIDIYPTMIDLCGLKPRSGLEGESLLRLLKDPSAPWERPALTTHGRGNHSLRTERWRYIRYSDGTEELYDHSKDPLEWTNLAGEAEYAKVKKALAGRLPKNNAPNSPFR